MSNDQRMVLVIQCGVFRQVVVEDSLEVFVAGIKLAPAHPVKYAAGESVDDEGGSIKGVEQYVVGRLFADPVNGQEFPAQYSGGPLIHSLYRIRVALTEVFAQRPEPPGLDPVETGWPDQLFKRLGTHVSNGVR